MGRQKNIKKGMLQGKMEQYVVAAQERNLNLVKLLQDADLRGIIPPCLTNEVQREKICFVEELSSDDDDDDNDDDDEGGIGRGRGRGRGRGTENTSKSKNKKAKRSEREYNQMRERLNCLDRFTNMEIEDAVNNMRSEIDVMLTMKTQKLQDMKIDN